MEIIKHKQEFVPQKVGLGLLPFELPLVGTSKNISGSSSNLNPIRWISVLNLSRPHKLDDMVYCWIPWRQWSMQTKSDRINMTVVRTRKQNIQSFGLSNYFAREWAILRSRSSDKWPNVQYFTSIARWLYNFVIVLLAARLAFVDENNLIPVAYLVLHHSSWRLSQNNELLISRTFALICCRRIKNRHDTPNLHLMRNISHGEQYTMNSLIVQYSRQKSMDLPFFHHFHDIIHVLLPISSDQPSLQCVETNYRERNVASRHRWVHVCRRALAIFLCMFVSSISLVYLPAYLIVCARVCVSEWAQTWFFLAMSLAHSWDPTEKVRVLMCFQ